jgi:hypothetical protein
LADSLLQEGFCGSCDDLLRGGRAPRQRHQPRVTWVNLLAGRGVLEPRRASKKIRVIWRFGSQPEIFVEPATTHFEADICAASSELPLPARLSGFSERPKPVVAGPLCRSTEAAIQADRSILNGPISAALAKSTFGMPFRACRCGW